MRTLQTPLACLLFALALVACSSGDDKTRHDAGAEPEVDAEVEPEADADAEPEPEPDAGSAPTAPVPLTVWVDDLVDHHTNAESEPDTVDDKVIADDTDETSFDKYLP